VIRAEIAYYRALAHWVRREYPEADRLAAAVEAAHADVLSVRATQLRAFVASAMAQFSQALALFRRAHFAYASCRGRDIDLATQILLQIASLEMTLRSAAVPGTHAKPGGRTIAGTTWGPAVETVTADCGPLVGGPAMCPARGNGAYDDRLARPENDHRFLFRRA
jgi:hypothetical protein